MPSRRRKKKKNGSKANAQLPASSVGVNEKLLKKLEAMGFDTKNSRRALILSDNNWDIALQHLNSKSETKNHKSTNFNSATNTESSIAQKSDPSITSTSALKEKETIDEGWTYKPKKVKQRKGAELEARKWHNFVSQAEIDRLARYDEISNEVEEVVGKISALPKAEMEALQVSLQKANASGDSISVGHDIEHKWLREKAQLQKQINLQKQQIHALKMKLSADNDIILSSLSFEQRTSVKSEEHAFKTGKQIQKSELSGQDKIVNHAETQGNLNNVSKMQSILRRYYEQFSKQLKRFFAEKATLGQQITVLMNENARLHGMLQMDSQAVVSQLLHEKTINHQVKTPFFFVP